MKGTETVGRLVYHAVVSYHLCWRQHLLYYERRERMKERHGKEEPQWQRDFEFFNRFRCPSLLRQEKRASFRRIIHNFVLPVLPWQWIRRQLTHDSQRAKCRVKETRELINIVDKKGANLFKSPVGQVSLWTSSLHVIITWRWLKCHTLFTDDDDHYHWRSEARTEDEEEGGSERKQKSVVLSAKNSKRTASIKHSKIISNDFEGHYNDV